MVKGEAAAYLGNAIKVQKAKRRGRWTRQPSPATDNEPVAELEGHSRQPRPSSKIQRGKTMLLILTIVLILALFGSLPTWPHSRDWGYYPSGGISLLLVILVVLLLMGRL